MSNATYILLENRGLLAVQGDDKADFLQGLISNDIRKVGPDAAIYAALLTAQGKFLHDFFILEMADSLLIDCEAGRLDDLKKKLSMYKLRAKVTLEDVSSDYTVAAIIGDGAAEMPASLAGGVVFTDPRLADMGCRAILPADSAIATLKEAGLQAGSTETYESLRLKLGLADGSRDMEVEKAILLENGFAELNGVDWDKGCYMGQELTARTHYRGLIKKRLMPVHINGPLPAPGTPVMFGDKTAGEIKSGLGDRALAMIRLEQFRAAENGEGTFSADAATVVPEKPAWATFPEIPET
ncbi:MAG: folate-binding protein YgfZ [Rhodospirillaceae bacterium]|nr:folate-binding protein YgfZ [Rhodospirillaceae bacterium]